MSTQDSNTKKIAYGELHFYYPFKFDNKYSYTQIHKKIEKSPLLFTDEYQQKVIDSLGYSLVETFNDIKKEFEASSSLNNPCILKMSDYQKYKSMKCAPMSINPDDILLEIESGESSIKFYIKDADLELLNQRIIRLQEEYDISLKFYGHNFTNRQDRFLLLPLKIELENGKFTWLYPLIYLFENNMGILKLELPIFDSCIEPLLENDYDRFLTKIINKWNIKNYNSETTLSSIQNFYLSNLLDDIKIDMVSYSNELKNIILIDFDGRPQHINSIPNDVKEDLFRIICAPVPSRNNTTYSKDADEYLKNHSWGGHGVKYIAKSTGGCLSFIDKTISDYVSDDYKTETKTSVLTPFNDYYNLCNKLARDLCVNVEFALIIILLKKTNESNDYFNKIASMKKLSDTRIEYNKNILFISELQENCYGSVSEQTALLEKMMPHYFKHEITSAKKIAIDNILQQNEQEKNERFQNYISTGGLILTLIFGLPSLYETLTIFRKLFSFYPYNIPYLTLENTSIILWLTLNGIIILKLYLRKYYPKIKKYCHLIVTRHRKSQESPKNRHFLALIFYSNSIVPGGLLVKS